MNEQELREAIALGHEVQNLEFKPSGPRTDPLLFAKILRAALGISNLRDGGYILIGIKEIGSGVQVDGLSDELLETWKYDYVAAAFAPYADPSIRFSLENHIIDGNKVLVIKVNEFIEVPVLCKKQLTVNGSVIIKEGACYVRSLKKPETAEVSSYEDMRALLDLGIEKRLRSFLAMANNAGLPLFQNLKARQRQKEH